MRHYSCSRCLTLCLAFLPCLLLGCADGPLGDLAAFNPYLRRKWEEDERYGPTFHRRMAELRGLRSGAARLAADKKQQMATDMSQLVQNETNPVLRAEAVAVLGELSVPSAVPALQAAMNDADKDVRIAACHAWGQSGGGEALANLSDILQRDSDVDVRLAAITELGRFQDRASVAALGLALDDLDPAIQHRAVESLKLATGQDYGDSVPAWRDYVHGRQATRPPSPGILEQLTNWF